MKHVSRTYFLTFALTAVFNINQLLGQGNALDFDDLDDFAQVLTPTLPTGAAPRTMELWFRADTDLFTDTDHALMQYGSTTAAGRMFGLITSSNAPGKLYFFGNFDDVAGVTNLEEGKWYHAAVTYDGTEVRLYLNGQLEGTETYSLNTILDGNGLTIGSRPGFNLWDGKIDEVRVWNIARTQADIQSTISTELTGSESNLVAYYNFNVGVAGGTNTGLTGLPDLSSTGQDATLNGFALTGSESNWIASEAFDPEIKVYLGTDNTGQELFDAQVPPVSYGNVTIGASRTLTFAIENTSIVDLDISSISVGGEFTITSPTNFTVGPGSTSTFTVQLDASADGISNSFVDINNNDTDKSVFTFPVTATRGSPDMKVWWTDEIGTFDDEIDRSNLDGTNFQPSYYSGFSADIKGIVVDTVNNMVFWTNTNDGTIRCGRIGDAGFVATGDVLDQFEGTSGVVDYLGVDVDGAARLIYWADATNNQIRRVNFDGSNVTDLIPIDDPRDVALDIAGGKIYYVANPSFVPQVWRADLDGSNPEMLYSSGSTFFNGIALDLINNHVYWTESVGGVSRADLDGMNQTFVTSQVTAPIGIDLDPANQMMYVADGGSVVRISYADDPAETVQTGAEVTSAQHVALDTRMFTGLIGGVIPSDYNALVELYNSTDGANWTSNTNWLTGDVNTWFGVSVVGDRVTELQLNNNNLNGTIPNELGDLTGLLDVTFQDNVLSGSIPTSVGNLVNLVDLFFDGNQLTGSIPTSLGGLSNLQSFDLDRNLLSGTIPTELGNLTALRELRLDENQLNGNIPMQLGSLSNLTHLELNDNDLSGSIPVEIGNLTNLTQLRLQGNQLTGSIPTQIGNLVNLIRLDFDSNDLSGAIPSELGNLSSLQDFDLNNNQLTGSIPSTIGNLSQLTRIDFNNNQLSGSIPPELGNLSNLDILIINNNDLTGSLPTELGNLSLVTNFDFHNNQLDGAIPTSIGSLTMITKLHLQGNQFAGTIPAELGNLINVLDFQLSNNQLTGDVPASFQNLTLVQDLRLDNNLLTGLPDLSGLTALTNFQVGTNAFEFDDLEPNAGISGFSFSPQANISSPGNQSIILGEALDVTVNVGGTNNVYQWVKDGMDLSGQTTNNLLITNVSTNDAGSYELSITNTTVSGLTLLVESFDVTVTDPNSPPDISYVFFIEEDVPNGTIIGAVEATDPDGDPLTYSIVSGNTGDAFAINASTGVLTVNDRQALNFDTTPSFDLLVEADDGQGGMTSVAITINLIEDVLGILAPENLRVYPNPVSEVLVIELMQTLVNQLDVAMYSQEGKQVDLRSISQSTSENTIELTLDHLMPGVYLLKLEANDHQFTIKNIIVR